MEKDDGSVTIDEDQIVSTIVNFYKELYRKPAVTGWGIERVEWCPIDGDLVLEIENPFSEDEGGI